MFSIWLVLLAVGSLSSEANYEDQSHWGGVCNNGARQSPVDINPNDLGVCDNVKLKVEFWNGTTHIDPLTAQPSVLYSEFPSSMISFVD